MIKYESEFESIKNEYYLFKEKIQYQIKINQMNSNFNNCYIINDSWDKEFNNNLDKYKNNKKIEKNIISYLIPKKELVIFNDIISIIKYLEKGGNIKLINKHLIESFYELIYLFFLKLF